MHTYDELFYLICDDVQDMDLTTALQSLLALFADITKIVNAEITEIIKNQVCNWIASQAAFIQSMFSGFCWES